MTAQSESFGNSTQLGQQQQSGQSMQDKARDGGSSMQDKAMDTASTMQDKAMETASTMQEKAMSGADAGIDRAAQGLSTAAERMRERSDTDDGARAAIETRAADAMEKTADYLSNHDSKELMQDIEDYVRQHPIQAAVGALAAGYVLGKIVR